MKIEKLDDDNFIVFLNKLYLNKNLFELKKNLDIYFKNLFKTLNECYNIEIMGYYNIKIFRDKIYGYILNIEKEDIDFYDYYDSHVDMRITINDDQKFIFKLNNQSVIDKEVLKYCHIRKLKDDVYLVPKRTINQYYLGYLVENSSIIYGVKADDIIKKSVDIKTNQIFVWK